MTLNTRGKKGKVNKAITVITNDPKQSRIILRISATVEVPQTNTTKTVPTNPESPVKIKQ